jgi:uncharacterized protein
VAGLRLLGLLAVSGRAQIANPGPVKVVIERRVAPGAEEAFKAWAERFVAAASRFPGHEGGSVLSVADSGVHIILLRFASDQYLDQWQSSAEHVTLMREADRVSAAGQASQIRSGMETWFTLPDMPAPVAPPPKWKMALVTWVALLPMVIALSYLLAPFDLPFVASVALSTAIPVATLTWVLMPRLTRVLYPWLYRGPRAPARAPVR